jgi:hypothetical protein
VYQSPIGLAPVASTKAMKTLKTAKAMKAMKCAKATKAMKAMKVMKAMKAMKAMKDDDCPGMYADAMAMKFAVAMKKAWDVHDIPQHWVPSVRSKWHVYKAFYEPPHCPCCPDWVRNRAMKHAAPIGCASCPDWVRNHAAPTMRMEGHPAFAGQPLPLRETAR